MVTQIPGAFATSVRGLTGNDVLAGYLGDDTLHGGAGDDDFVEGVAAWEIPGVPGFVLYVFYNFGLGNDVLYGGDGIDYLSYDRRSTGLTLDVALGVMTSGTERDLFSGIELFTLTASHDLVTGTRVDSAFELSSGNDTLVAGTGLAYAHGGIGNDVLDLSGLARPLTINLVAGTSSSGFEFFDFETVLGALAAPNRFLGSDAANSLTGGNLVDTVYGGLGADTIASGKGSDLVWGGEGADLLINDGGADLIYGGDGLDNITGHDMADTLYGGTDTDRHFDDNLFERIDGKAGDDLIFSDCDRARLYGGDGNDVIRFAGGSATIAGGAGDDSIYSKSGAAEASVFGGDGNDLLVSDAQVNSYGGMGDDSFHGGLRIYGGAGNDRVVERAAETGVGWIWFGAGDDTVQFADRGPYGGSYGVYGEAGNDVISLGFASNGAYGGTGNDDITLRTGLIDGGAGNDTLSVRDAPFRSTVLAGSGDDVVTLGDPTAPPPWYHDFAALGGAGRDKLIVNGGSILVTDDPIYDRDGVLTSVSGFEEIIVASSDAHVTYLRQDFQTLFGGTNDTLFIDASDRSYDMGAGDNEVYLRADNDTVLSGEGNDTIQLSQRDKDGHLITGGYLIRSGTGNDALVLWGAGTADAGAGHDAVTVLGAVQLDAGAGNDRVQFGDLALVGYPPVLEPIGNLTGSYSDLGLGNDTAIVYARPTSVDMGYGNDRVMIATASPNLWYLTGGAGGDHFQFTFAWSHGQVRITDFDAAVDRLSIIGVSSAADLDSVTSYGAGVRITEKNWVILLPTVKLADIGDVQFVAQQDFYS